MAFIAFPLVQSGSLNNIMADTLKVSIWGARIAAAVALDCDGYIAEHPGTTNADIAGILGITPSQLSDAKRGFYQMRAEQVAIMARFGMTRTLAVTNEIAEERETRADISITLQRAMQMFRDSSAAVDATLSALADGHLTKAEKATCESRILTLQNSITMLLRALRGTHAE